MEAKGDCGFLPLPYQVKCVELLRDRISDSRGSRELEVMLRTESLSLFLNRLQTQIYLQSIVPHASLKRRKPL